jgi:hypothetical protein
MPNGKFFISSSPLNSCAEARFSKQMEVTLTSQNTYKQVFQVHSLIYCKFQVQFLDPTKRIQMNGQPVPVHEPVLLQHCYSMSFLANDFISYLNDFGREYEVFCKSFQSLGKSHNLMQEKEGLTTVLTSLRR